MLDVDLPTKAANATENASLIGHSLGEVSPAVGIAAMWLSQHRDEIAGPFIPFVMKTFELGIREAIAALKLGHRLRYGG